MREPSKVKWPKVIMGLMCTILFVFIVAAGILASSPKTDRPYRFGNWSFKTRKA